MEESSEGPREGEIILRMKPHTKAKHRILQEYLNAWLPIMLQSWGTGRIVYLDGFAGSGVYDDGSYGSPIIALDCANNHQLRANFRGETIFIFIEIDKNRADHLSQLLEQRYGPRDKETYAKLPKTYKVEMTNGDFNFVIKGIVEKLEKEKLDLAPTMAFIDPYGYSELDIDLLARILKFNKCELLITYMAGFIDRFASDERHKVSIIRTLKISEDDLLKASAIQEVEQRELVWLKYLNNAIVNASAAMSGTPQPIYKLYFKMLDASNHTLYYLVYFTKSPKGIEVMKHAMSKAGKQWSYRFSDYDFDPRQSTILDYTNEKPWIRDEAERIYQQFRGKDAFGTEVRMFILLETIWSFSSQSLRLLEESERLTCLGGRTRRFTYPETAMLRFK